MADPITWVALGSLALTAAGTGVAVAGQMQQAESAAKAAEANARVRQQQAGIAREQASLERHRAMVEVENAQRRQRRERGTRVSAIGASGLALSGSALDVIADQALVDAQERGFIMSGGEQRARAQERAGQIEGMRATEFQRRAAAERRAAPIRATGTILTGLGGAGIQAAQFRQAGGF